MELYGFYWALFALLIAIGTVLVIGRVFRVELIPGRVSTIDGLRGYLAFSVFLHHSVIWFEYLRSGRWVVPQSNFYTALGQASVSLFFMITAFLFFSKLLNEKNGVNWLRLYVSRVMRIMPMYLFVVGVMLVVVGVLSDWKLAGSLSELLVEVAKWVLFFQVNVNDVNATALITAGVTWTLPYEWVFYLALPAFALFLAGRSSWLMFVFPVLGFVYANEIGVSPLIMLSFVGGVVAALLVRFRTFCDLARTKSASVFALALLGVVFTQYGSIYGPAPIFFISVIFSLFAGGASLFGLLSGYPARLLGEITYSVYLLHGLVLFVFFKFIIGFGSASKLSVIGHWSLILCLTPVVVVLSYASFHYLERPAIRLVPVLSDRISLFTSMVRGWVRNRAGASDVD